MSDKDRYRWLDEEAAERLLRGWPVNARSATPRIRDGADSSPSDRLAAVLDELVAEQITMRHALGAGHAERLMAQPVELPGEEAAVEAFRTAHADILHSGTIDISAGPTETGTVVGRRAVRENGGRSGGRRRGGRRRSSLAGRPLRAGFAMAVAGCALGGAAVAAGAGVLPTPFGGGGAPAASVSPMASPSAADREPAGGDSVNPGGSSYPGRGQGQDAGSSSSHSPGDGGLADSGHGHKSGDKNTEDPKGHGGWGHGHGATEAEKQQIAKELCAAYEDEKLPAQDRLRLEQAAGSAAAVHKFCSKHGGDGHENAHSGGTSDSGGIGTPGDSGGTGDVGGSSSGSDGGGDSGGAADGGQSGGGSGGETGGDTSGSDGGTNGAGVSSSSPTPSPTPSPSS